MASLFQCAFSPSHHHRITSVLSLPQTPRCSLIPCCFPRIRTSETLFNPAVLSNGKSFTNTEFACNSGVTSAIYTSETEQTSKAKDIVHSKLKLLSAVCGQKTGFAAREEDLEKAEQAAKDLESVSGPVDLPNDLRKLQGKWKLIYSSAFSSHTIGGSRIFRTIVRVLPITIGQVFQRIDVSSKGVDNIVEIELGTPLLLPPPELVATLAYKFELTGTSKIKIRSEKPAVIRTGQSENLPSLELLQIPDALWPSSFTGTGDFCVTYVDSDTRRFGRAKDFCHFMILTIIIIRLIIIEFSSTFFSLSLSIYIYIYLIYFILIF